MGILDPTLPLGTFLMAIAVMILVAIIMTALSFIPAAAISYVFGSSGVGAVMLFLLGLLVALYPMYSGMDYVHEEATKPKAAAEAPKED